ncbi:MULTISPECIES: hypothetical protein [Pseudomonas]|uniref:Uncharacterized protein n=1 Tax=Pseudomonas frederiksbergensis TaxID=104087 RepID=A0A2S8HNI5_9PSED|nr:MULTISPECIES: hypothetical protein [Pseudomonas]PQP04064.1 hypothetical protein C5612_12620 [Pseudomonas frederiksbergensis]WLG53284.1 hypothetical protein PSH64_12475 [Pseudomonas sp. FP1742]
MNSPLDINKVFIPGWVTPVIHPGNPEGGVPLSLIVNQLLSILVDPWLNMSSFDSADLLVNGSTTATANKIIQPGEENKRFTMKLPEASLRNGINELKLRVTRVSQDPETSLSLVVLFNTPGPGGVVPGSGDNLNLFMTLPADVIAKGVDAARAAQGVDVTLSYVYMRERDVIRLDCDGQDVLHTVTAAEAVAGRVVLTLFARDFWQDNPRFALRFQVKDLLGNPSGPQAVWSQTTYIDVHVQKPLLDLIKPEVLEAKVSNGTVIDFERDFYEAKHATVKVAYTGSNRGQTVKAYWVGRATTYGSEIQTVSYAGEKLTFLIPRHEVLDCIGTKAEVRYTVRLPGDTLDQPSKDLNLTVTSQKHHLPAPTLNAGKDNLRVYYPTLEAPYKVRISLLVGSTRYDSVEYNITQPTYTNVPVPPAWVSNNKGKEGLFNYTLHRTGTAEPIIFSWILRVIL